MSKVWYLSIQGVFVGLWYVMSRKSEEMGKNQILWKLTSLEWVSTYITFTYFFLALLASFRSTIIKQKLRVSLYLLTVSLLASSLLVSFVLTFIKNPEEIEEITIDFPMLFSTAMTKGGFLILTLIEMKNIKNFDCPSWTILIIFDTYLIGWYCFVQFMCKRATGSYSYPFLNDLTNEQLIFVGMIMICFILFVKYIIISISPPPKKPKQQVQEKKPKKE
ncbi:hypothetical protein SteCoe_36750 [Stentor coeruleus]|uniref:Uncharacterized protein n=1 Tax=Stentor coeruleus TaxID=5963 RepID=A0A1R2APJ1_9CILI|nr:hypothetical protein SteCoe_36750 [Stentor coeruleus]